MNLFISNYSRKLIRFLVFILLLSAALQAADTYTNPVVISNDRLADPTILKYDGNGKYYMYPTGDNVSYHVYTSIDLVNWTKGKRVFQPGVSGVWAPDVYHSKEDGKFYMYYTAGGNIGVAVATRPDGTFIDQGIILENSIDAHFFAENGEYYLYFTEVDHGNRIYVQKMSSHTELTGEKHLILEPDQGWDQEAGWVNEAPWMLKHKGTYYLLFSGSGANTQEYGVGYATADNPMGPFTKYENNPIIEKGGGVYGPGHGSVTTDDDGNLWHIYHQKHDENVNWNRFICLDPMWFDSNGVLHSRATRGQELPAPKIDGNKPELAYWRFEEGPADADVSHGGLADGFFFPGVADVTGNGNPLSVWNQSYGGYVYKDETAFDTVPQTGQTNNFSVKNSGGNPNMFTSIGAFVSSVSPSEFTVQATFRLEDGGYRGIVGRDSFGTANKDSQLSAFYLQAIPGNGVAVKFCDVQGYWHDAISDIGVIETFDWGSNPSGEGVPFYSAAAVSDGEFLSLYLYNHDKPEEGYKLVAQENMLEETDSTNTALTGGAGDGPDWDAGNWTVGRAMYNGGHADRAWGYIDEVKITAADLRVTDFLQGPAPYSPDVSLTADMDNYVVEADFSWNAPGSPEEPVLRDIVNEYVFISSSDPQDDSLYYAGDTGIDPGNYNPESSFGTAQVDFNNTCRWAVVAVMDGFEQNLTAGQSTLEDVDSNNLIGPIWSFDSLELDPGIEAQPSEIVLAEDSSESGCFGVNLASRPMGDVQLNLSEKYSRGQITVSPQNLLFTPQNWSAGQDVCVQTVDDDMLESPLDTVPVEVSASSSEDQYYDGLTAEPFAVKIEDDECGSAGYLKADFNLDCEVGMDDFSFFAQQWLSDTLVNN
ncbi:Extracellular exo-alpha-(1-_5)-L-arabinofuranosidase precursor [Sedimentisphaera cyanobacteriorum]|uniref:Extracellular exo-alpha-(1->5)-L-arabinofuranosidase n=1 Tax=Sedimentisphaera cyanobacteriorum TaxID=1940790 RepID=A0A1Q2HN25_9BACT|nr:glycoside hydrolase family 43 protein [Sedimentisphaera cyanobacteriorum]AQQ08665.1 Extracellular exo-alpha-(1->5)-L-arabinofuranosidase precursor [Sedimentisphaera cyanobacteriorum]